MKTYQQKDVKAYLGNDWIMHMLQKEELEEEKEIRTNIWMRTMENKRMVYADVYGDILNSKLEKSVLDVGGGVQCTDKSDG